MSNRITQVFSTCQNAGRAALVTYVTAGDPEPGATVPVLHALVRGGADVIELGVPFSDPMADGPEICRAMDRALAHGTSFRDVLTMVRSFRESNEDTPVVLFGYLNPLVQYGLKAACLDARDAGADGFLVVDLPPEEAHELRGLAEFEGLDFIGLFTPTSDADRIETIADVSSGFAYYVSMTGVTGGQISDFTKIAEQVASVRNQAELPVAVGFGVRTPEDVATVARFADGVVVGSALIRAIHEGSCPETAAEAFLKPMSQALTRRD